MANKISKSGIDFIKGFESFVPYVYDDKIAPKKGKYAEWKGGDVRGTLTVGYGHTNAAKHPLKIVKGLRVTEKEACEILDVDLDECEADVSAMVKVPLEQGQYDACVSLTFNMGSGNFKKSSLLARLNRGDYNGARAAFDLYNKSGGEYMRGLQRRRDGEQALWDEHDVIVPDEPVHHPAEVDQPPPAPILLPEPKTMRETAGKSGTVGLGLSGIVMLIWGYISNGFNYLFDLFFSLLGGVPTSLAGVSPLIGQAQELSGWLNIPWAKISAGLAVALIGGMIYRHVRDVRWLDKGEQSQ